MRIGELSARSGVLVETIRYYERVGLLPAPPRSASSGYRAYDRDYLRRLVFLRRSRQLGFSSKEVRTLLSLTTHPERTCKDVTRLAADHLSAVRSKIGELKRLERALEELVRGCPGDVSIAHCAILEALEEDAH